MLLRRTLPAAAFALVLPLSACTGDDGNIPDTPPTEMKARVIQGGDSKTYDLTACAMIDEQSLTAYGTDHVLDFLVMNIEDGSGDITVLNGTETPSLQGTTTSYAPESDGLFTVEGVDSREGEETFQVWGNCNPIPQA